MNYNTKIHKKYLMPQFLCTFELHLSTDKNKTKKDGLDKD
jgi:hypothetical protein